MEPGGGQDFFPGVGQPGLPLKETNLLGDDSAVDIPFVQQVQEQAGYHPAIRGLGPHFGVLGPGQGGFEDVTDWGPPGYMGPGFLIKFMNFRAN